MYYIPIAPHNIGSPVQTVANCHVMAAVPNFLVLEFHHLDNRFWEGIINEGPLIREGHIDVPNLPGLGVTLNEELLRNNFREEFGFFD